MNKPLIALAALGLTACSPMNFTGYVSSAGHGYSVEAEAGPDNSLGDFFYAQVLCSGESFWRNASPVSVNTSPNFFGGRLGGNHWISTALCPSGRIAVGGSWGQGHS